MKYSGFDTVDGKKLYLGSSGSLYSCGCENLTDANGNVVYDRRCEQHATLPPASTDPFEMEA